ncbi:MAG: hypothetical protein JWP10_727 [Nocardioidaceae bacterium]|nr:hypothetical protein [Nocardioidaceae bacterium]
MAEVEAGLPHRLVEFVSALRRKGITTGTSETVDAAAVISVLGMGDRNLLREGLAAALVRRGGQRDVFDLTFDLYFPVAMGATEDARTIPVTMDVTEIRHDMVEALATGDIASLEKLAAIAVEVLGQLGVKGELVGGWSAYQTLDRLQPQTLVAPALSAREGLGLAQSGFAERLARDEIRQQIAAFREMVASEARRRTAELRGRERIHNHAVRLSSERIDFLSANATQLEELRRTVRPLSRKLATRLSAKRRRRNRGSIDIRKTLRRAMSTGGVPMRPAYAKPHPTRPELVLLCDVSGSVSGFSNFTMLLVQAMSGQFSKIRVFAFINAMAEVTDLIKDETGDLSKRIGAEAKITKWHTSSDYGEAFGDFAADHLSAVGPRTAVLILGDARNNNQRPNFDALHRISSSARRTFWLNPEDSSKWGLGDSIALEYADVVEMHECRNVEQLSQFVSRLLPV